VNRPESTGLHILNEQIVWYVNYISIKLFQRERKKKTGSSCQQKKSRGGLLRLWMEMAVWLHPGDEQISENDKTFHWEKVTEFFFF
jgi:hypothetical protein